MQPLCVCVYCVYVCRDGTQVYGTFWTAGTPSGGGFTSATCPKCATGTTTALMMRHVLRVLCAAVHYVWYTVW